MLKKVWLKLLLPGVLILVVGVGMVAKSGMKKVAAEDVLAQFPDRGVPRMNITLNGVTLDEIKAGSKEAKYEGNKVTMYEGDNTTLEASGVRVKGRGNGTWMRDKKPYQIKFKEKVDLLGLGKAKKWVLLANAMDASNLRTATAFRLEEMLGMKYGMVGEFVELYIDGEYEGLYYLTHVVEIGKTTVDLKDSMGVLVELDNLYYGAEKYYETGNGDHLVMKDVVDEAIGKRVMEEFVRGYDEFERAVTEGDYERVSELVDVESFAKYYLLSEFSVNPDAYWTSFFMYKDGAEDKIHAGPGWDFDMAFANRWWGNWMGDNFYSPTQTMVRRGELLPKESYDEMGLSGANGGVDWYGTSLSLSKIMFDVMEMPEFREEVSRVYQETMSGRIEELVWWLQNVAEEITMNAKIDNEKWEKGDFEENVQAMEGWIRERYEHFEKEYDDRKSVNEVKESPAL